MKKHLTLLVLMTSLVASNYAQSESGSVTNTQSLFRRGYLRVGINTLGGKLESQLSPKDNLYAGNYGAGMGYCLETGHIFYFLKRQKYAKFNVGLDWTIISISYNPLAGWGDYANTQTINASEVGDAKMSLAFSSKIGPVFSFKPFEKFVVDARVQVGYQVRANFLSYEDFAEDQSRYFGGEQFRYLEFDGFSFGVVPSVGFTIRRKALGISADWSKPSISTGFEAIDADGKRFNGFKNIPTKELQVKFSLHF